MKKRILILSCIPVILSLSACGKENSDKNPSYTMGTTEEYTAYSYESEERSYTNYIKECPNVIRSKEDWFDNGHLILPFSEEEFFEWYEGRSLREAYAAYYVPDEVAAVASTSDLINIMVELSVRFHPYYFYDFPSYLIDIQSNIFNVVDLAFSRNDFGKSLLDVYLISEYVPVGGDEDLGYKQDIRLGCMEIYLATDYVFDQLTEEQRKLVLAEIERKNKQIINGEVICNISRKKSLFYVMIDELIENGKSKWYDYMNK